MNKADLVNVMAEKSGLQKKDAEKALNAFIEGVTEALAKKDSVQLVGFGTFTTTERPARTGRNPRTGEAMKIAAKTCPKFKVGSKLDKACQK